MGRKKLPLEFIKNPKSRMTTFFKRRSGLKKKARELSILCDIDACFICFESSDTQSPTPCIWPENPSDVDRVIRKFRSIDNKIHNSGVHSSDLVQTSKREMLEERHEESNTCDPDVDLEGFSFPALKQFEHLLILQLSRMQNRLDEIQRMDSTCIIERRLQ